MAPSGTRSEGEAVFKVDNAHAASFIAWRAVDGAHTRATPCMRRFLPRARKNAVASALKAGFRVQTLALCLRAAPVAIEHGLLIVDADANGQVGGCGESCARAHRVV